MTITEALKEGKGKATNKHFVTPGGSIQEKIDLASPGDIVIVPPGNYEGPVMIRESVRLEGRTK